MSGALHDVPITPASSDEPVVPGRPKRPVILTLVTLLLYGRVILVSLGATLLFLQVFADGRLGRGEEGTLLMAVLTATLAGLLLVATTGLWLLKPWAWQLNMLTIGFLLITNLWQRAANTTGFNDQLGILLNIVTVFYLIQSDVRALFIHKTPGSP